jgi:hypothetical protein
MFTKTTFALIGTLIFGSAPALAGHAHRHVHAMSRNWSAPAGHAFGQARPDRFMSSQPEHVIVNGIDQGTDPDPLIRLQLLRDPPHSG